MTDLILIEEFKAHLVANLICRADNDDVGKDNPPPCVLSPKDGPAQPAGKKDVGDWATVTLRASGGLPTGHLEGFLAEEVVEVVVRARHNREGELLQRVIRGSVNDKHNFMLGALRVQWCLMYRSTQPVPLPDGASVASYDSTQSFMLQVRVADLTV